jgi:hypothetical protein
MKSQTVTCTKICLAKAQLKGQTNSPYITIGALLAKKEAVWTLFTQSLAKAIMNSRCDNN